MAMIAIAAGILGGGRVRRGPNLRRQGCETAERDWLSLRLTNEEVQTLTREFCEWRLEAEGVRTSYFFCERRMKLFLLYLAAADITTSLVDQKACQLQQRTLTCIKCPRFSPIPRPSE
jgi:hypothetical protein